jgi:hypothetical protein
MRPKAAASVARAAIVLDGVRGRLSTRQSFENDELPHHLHPPLVLRASEMTLA